MAKFDIIAATGCPTGIAHTFMAKEALEKAAAERGLTIKVETHGQVGVENELTKSEIAGAKAVVVAADKDVQAERFAGKRMVSVGVSKALSVEAAGKLIDRALAAKGDDSVAAAADVEDEVEEKESIGHIIYKHLMNGVSHMLVFVVAGGVLTAVSFLWGITSFDSTASDYNSFAAMLKIIGGIAMNLMVPVLSAYIAESIGKRPALVPGFVAGMIAIQGLPVNAETGMIDAGGAGVGFGFLGGIVGGFLAGYVILLLEKVFSKLPKNLDGLKAIFLYPLFSTAIVGLVMLGISGPMVSINNGMMDFLRSLQHVEHGMLHVELEYALRLRSFAAVGHLRHDALHLQRHRTSRGDAGGRIGQARRHRHLRHRVAQRVLHSGEQLFPVALFHQLGSQGEPSPLAKGVQRLIEGQKALLSLLAVQKIPQHPVHKQLSDLGAKPLVHDRVKAHGKASRL